MIWNLIIIALIELGWIFLPVQTAVAQGDMTISLGNMRRHQEWHSAKIKLPVLGKFIAGRAFTQNKTQKVSLVVDIRPDKNAKYCIEDVGLIVDSDKPAVVEEEYGQSIELTIDNKVFETLQTKCEILKGGRFFYFTFPKDFRSSVFSGHRTLLVNIKGFTFVELSLAGFMEAKKAAMQYCRTHITE